MKFNDKLITAIAAIVVGVLFIALKGDVLSIAFTVLGAALIVMGILDAAKKDSKSGTVKIVAGLVTVLLGWTLVSITLYIVAALMILYCLMNLVSSLKTDGYSMSTVQKLRTCKAGHRSCCRHLSPAEPRRYRLLGVHLYRYCFHR